MYRREWSQEQNSRSQTLEGVRKQSKTKIVAIRENEKEERIREKTLWTGQETHTETHTQGGWEKAGENFKTQESAVLTCPRGRFRKKQLRQGLRSWDSKESDEEVRPSQGGDGVKAAGIRPS